MTTTAAAAAPSAAADVREREAGLDAAQEEAQRVSVSALRHSLCSDKAILKLMQEQRIAIQPFSLTHLSTSSYDVTLGPYYYRESDPEPGIAIYNPYSQSMVQKVWGEPRHAELVADWSKRTGQVLENVQPTDRIIWLKPGETILGHTLEFIGGRQTVTTMMKARSSMGRNFIEVCKCFPPETRLLTSRGFKFVANITLDDRVATYNPETRAIEYHQPLRVMSKSAIDNADGSAANGRHRMVRVKTKRAEEEDGAVDIELATTDDHDWFVRRADDAKYGKVEAREFVPQQQQQQQQHATFHVMTRAENGIGANATGFPTALAQQFGLDASRTLALIELCGVCIAATSPPCVADDRIEVVLPSLSSSSSSSARSQYVSAIFAALGVRDKADGEVIVECENGEAAVTRVRIAQPSIVALLRELVVKRPRARSASTTASSSSRSVVVDEEDQRGVSCAGIADDDSDAAADDDESIPSWVFDLTVDELRSFVQGFARATCDAAAAADSNDSLFVRSARVRDELLHLLVLAGYSPSFRSSFTRPSSRSSPSPSPSITNDSDGWIDQLGRRCDDAVGKLGESEIRSDRDVSTYETDATVYCLTVPNNLVFAQTARVHDGVVTACSQTVIVGQCAGWGDVGYVNRWTMEITNNSRHYSIPLVVGRRIAQIVFFATDGTIASGQQSYESSGKYQRGGELDELIAQWQPADMLPKMFLDREIVRGPQIDLLADKAFV